MNIGAIVGAAVGIWCPACGGLRAVNDLTNGDVLGAASSNLVFVECPITFYARVGQSKGGK